MELEDLVPKAKNWTSDGCTEDLALETWVAMVGNFELAIGYSVVFWPRFKMVGDSIVRHEVQPSNYSMWLSRLDGDIEAVERTINHLHILDLHHIGCEDASAERLRVLGEITRQSTEAKLRLEYPQRDFVVSFAVGDPEDLSQYELTFWQRRNSPTEVPSGALKGGR